MMAILTKYWRPLAIIIIVAICALWVVNKVSSYGEQRYNDGYAKAVAEQKRPQTNKRSNDAMQNYRRFRPTPSKGLILRAMMPLMLLLSLAGCSNNSQISAGSSSDIPPLSPLAIQPQKPEFCSPTCSANLSKETDNWQITLTGQESGTSVPEAI